MFCAYVIEVRDETEAAFGAVFVVSVVVVGALLQVEVVPHVVALL